MSRTYYVYILLCADGSYYTGVTNHVDRRVWEHREWLSDDAYTKTRRPVKLMYTEAFTTAYEAISAEKQIKRWSHGKKEALIRREYIRLRSLAHGRRGYMSKKSTVTSSPDEG